MGLEWWRKAAEQSTAVRTAKRPSANMSDIPATARSSISCAPWNTAPSDILFISPTPRLASPGLRCALLGETDPISPATQGERGDRGSPNTSPLPSPLHSAVRLPFRFLASPIPPPQLATSTDFHHTLRRPRAPPSYWTAVKLEIHQDSIEASHLSLPSQRVRVVRLGILGVTMLHIKSEPGTREEEAQEHEQKVNKYQAILAARLKAKYFSNKAFDGGKIFEAETIVDGQTIQSSRWPCTSSFTNPVIFFRDKNSHERKDSPSLVPDSSAKNDSPSVVAEASPKNNANALAAENNLTPSKRQPSKET
ncbi:hypothetical protein ACQ4PT_047229 [Festuca glaucescens]